MMRKSISEMKYLILITTLLLLMILSGCTTTSVNMDHCKRACRGQVQHYQDDEVECSCKLK